MENCKMTPISSLDLHELVKEFQFLIDSKIDKLFMENNEELFIQLHLPNIGKKVLRIAVGKTMHLTELKPELEQPTDFCMRLRKLINNARLRKIEQLDFERILSIELEKDQTYYLFMEFFGKGNIILTDKDKKIIACLTRQKFSQRTVASKETYTHPQLKYNLLKLTKEELKGLLATTSKDSLVTALAIELGLGGKYAEQLCELAGIDKTKKPNELKDTTKLFSSIAKLKVDKDSCDTFSQLLDKQYEQELTSTKSDKELEHDKELKRLEKIITIQKLAAENYEKAIKEDEKKAELIYQNYQLIDKTIKELQAIEKKHSWQEIRQKLKNHKLIKDVDEKHKTIVVELS